MAMYPLPYWGCLPRSPNVPEDALFSLDHALWHHLVPPLLLRALIASTAVIQFVAFHTAQFYNARCASASHEHCEGTFEFGTSTLKLTNTLSRMIYVQSMGHVHCSTVMRQVDKKDVKSFHQIEFPFGFAL